MSAPNMDDLAKVLEMQGMSDFVFAEGDALLFRYNWERHWDNPPEYNKGTPGICMDVARWGRRGRQGGRGRG